MSNIESLHHMKDSTIAYFGVPGSFGHLMAVRHFGKDNIFVGTQNQEEVFKCMDRGDAQYGVVTLENNWVGPLRENFDHILAHKVFIVGDEYLIALHHLISVKVKSKTIEERIAMVRKVLSHPKSLEQCSTFLAAHPYMEPTVFSDTGRSAQYVADMGDPSIAAIATREAARIYNLDILCENVHSSSYNITRYGFIGREEYFDPDANKGSIIATVEHKPGQLFRLLEVLARDDCNVTWIEQRLLGEDLLNCLIFVDFEFPGYAKIDYNKTFEDLRSVVKDLRVLGVYKSVQPGTLH